MKVMCVVLKWLWATRIFRLVAAPNTVAFAATPGSRPINSANEINAEETPNSLLFTRPPLKVSAANNSAERRCCWQTCGSRRIVERGRMLSRVCGAHRCACLPTTRFVRMHHQARLAVVVPLLWLAACRGGDRPVFERLSADRTGVSFANTITTDDSLNVQSDVYVYNGAGVAVGDIDNDGL